MNLIGSLILSYSLCTALKLEIILNFMPENTQIEGFALLSFRVSSKTMTLFSTCTSDSQNNMASQSNCYRQQGQNQSALQISNRTHQA